MRITTIASGSSGNCYVLTDNHNNSLIIEAGKGTFEDALKVIPDISKIAGVIISHKHSDHYHDADFWIKYGIKVYTPDNMEHATQMNLECGDFIPFSIISLAVEHDVNINCNAFFIRCNFEENQKTIFFVTDCYNYSRIIDALPEPLSLALIEVNHDAHILDTGSYPADLKERVRKSHCSVQRASLAVQRAKCQRFLLIHPSAHNINQEEALKLLRDEFPNRSFEFARPGLVLEV